MDAHLLHGALCAFRNQGRLILRFMRRIVPFRALPLIAPGVAGGGAAGVLAIHSFSKDTLKYGPGKVSGTMGTGQNSYCPIEIRLNKTRSGRLVLSPTEFFRARASASLTQKAHLLRDEGARGGAMRLLLCAPPRLIMPIMGHFPFFFFN